jgi:hypothetical protein
VYYILGSWNGEKHAILQYMDGTLHTERKLYTNTDAEEKISVKSSQYLQRPGHGLRGSLR